MAWLSAFVYIVTNKAQTYWMPLEWEKGFRVQVKLRRNVFGVIYHSIYANSPGLSGSLPDTEPISRSPVRVTKTPG